MFIQAVTVSWRGSQKERDYLENLGLNGRIILKWIRIHSARRAWNGSIRLRIGTGGGFL